jgi:rhodanese-related sulfurtransferase
MTYTPQAVRAALIAREEIALIDLREEHDFAQGHPLFAAQIPLRRIALEAAWRIPRKDALVVVYDDGEDGQHLVEPALAQLRDLGFTQAHALAGGLQGWREAGYELFEDVNSYSKAFGELVEHRRHTPSLPAPDVQALIEEKADIAILDARRFDEYATMSIPGGVSAPGAELVLRARAVAPDPDTTIIVNCAGRTRSIIGAQSLVNAGLPNRVYALRNGTIGWTLAGQGLETGQQRRAACPKMPFWARPRQGARGGLSRGVKRISAQELAFCAPTRPARSTNMMCACPRIMRRAICRAFAMRRAANWCRKPTISPPCGLRASCWPTILAPRRHDRKLARPAWLGGLCAG